eukprot:gb/GECG01014907.1/.p1 GENE.gb/GECG01014907.1/~~gb/GECG01014907.1/.p1  ORF type:complete len:621 (+),score=94.67 gb/GECG01014907.1/:1-1863(+)
MPSPSKASSSSRKEAEQPPSETSAHRKPSHFPYWRATQHIRVPAEVVTQLQKGENIGGGGGSKKGSSNTVVPSNNEKIEPNAASEFTREALTYQYEYARHLCPQDTLTSENFRENYLTMCETLNLTPHPQLLPKRKERDVARVQSAALQSRSKTPESTTSFTIRTPSAFMSRRQGTFWNDSARSNNDAPLVEIDAYEISEKEAQEAIVIKNHKLDYGTLVVLVLLLAKHENISALSIQNAGVDQPMLSFICETLSSEHSPGLRRVFIDFCEESLACDATRTLQRDTEEKEEEVSSSKMSPGDPGFIGYCIETLLSKAKLELLQFRGNGVSSDDSEFVAKGLVQTQELKALNLFGNRLGDKGSAALAKGIRENRSLEELSVANNAITEDGIEAIVRSLFPVKYATNALQMRETWEALIFGSGQDKGSKGKKGAKQSTKSTKSAGETERPTALPELTTYGSDSYLCSGNPTLLAIDWSGNKIQQYSALAKLSRKLASRSSNLFLTDTRDYDPEGRASKEKENARPGSASSRSSNKSGRKGSARRGSTSKKSSKEIKQSDSEEANVEDTLPHYSLQWINSKDCFAPKLCTWEIPGAPTPEEEAKKEYEKVHEILKESKIEFLY